MAVLYLYYDIWLPVLHAIDYLICNRHSISKEIKNYATHYLVFILTGQT